MMGGANRAADGGLTRRGFLGRSSLAVAAAAAIELPFVSRAESTMTAIMGREAAYGGRSISWEAAITSNTRLGPDKYEFGPYPIPPVAMPGQYKFS